MNPAMVPLNTDHPPALADLPTALRRFVGQRVADPHAADDITQDVLLKLHVNLRSNAGPAGATASAKLSAWVYAVARNAIIDHYRVRAIRHHDVDLLEPSELVDDAGERDAIAGLAACLQPMTARLPDPYATALRRVELDGLSQADFAAETGLSLSGAKSRVQRARQILREMIERCCRVERDGRGHVVDYHPADRSAGDCGGADPMCRS